MPNKLCVCSCTITRTMKLFDNQYQGVINGKLCTMNMDKINYWLINTRQLARTIRSDWWVVCRLIHDLCAFQWNRYALQNYCKFRSLNSTLRSMWQFLSIVHTFFVARNKFIEIERELFLLKIERFFLREQHFEFDMEAHGL